MKKHITRILLIMLGAAVLFLAASASSLGTVQGLASSSLARWLIASGGGTASGGVFFSRYTLSDSIGQSIVGSSSDGNYSLHAGYQLRLEGDPAVPGDYCIYLPVVRAP